MLALLAAHIAAPAGHPNALAQPIQPISQAQAPADEPALSRPAAANRLVRLFDFEGPGLDPVPLDWFRAQNIPGTRDRPGFPSWNGASLDSRAPAHSGRTSLRLPSDSRSSSLRLSPGVIPVFPGADYRISAWVRTARAEHARARLVARFLDSAGQPIPGTEVMSKPLATAGSRQPITVDLWGLAPNAADLQVDLELVQPEYFRKPNLREHQVWLTDIDASAWFDDVTVTLLPRVELTTDAPGNIATAPNPPTLTALVRDLTGQSLVLDMIVHDATGSPIAREIAPIPSVGMAYDWQPTIDRFGWYRAVLHVRTQSDQPGAPSVPVARSHVDFLYVPEPRTLPTFAHPFGLDTTRLPPAFMAGVIDAERSLATRALTLAAWDDTLTDENTAERVNTLAPIIETLAASATRITIAIPSVPEPLRRRAALDAHDVATMLASDRALWSPYLDPMLERFGQAVRRWQMGIPLADELDPLAYRPTPDQLATARTELATLVPGPLPTLPHPPHATLAEPDEDEASSPVRPAHLLHATPDVRAEAIAPMLAAQRESTPTHEIAILFEPTSPEPTSAVPTQAVADIARRVIAAWAALPHEPGSIEHTPPLVFPCTSSAPRRPQPLPTPELAAWRTLATALSGRYVAATLPTRPGITALVLAPIVTDASESSTADRSGAVVAWATDAEPAPGDTAPMLELYLGAGTIIQRDLFGNTQPITLSARTLPDSEPRPIHRIPLSGAPLFIEGVDANLALFAAGAALDPADLPTTGETLERELILTNPYDRPISGRWFISEPAAPRAGKRGWDIRPRSGTISIDPRSTARMPITIAFPPVEPTGPRRMTIDIELAADIRHPWFQVSIPIDVGTPDLTIDAHAYPAPTPFGPDVVVEAHVRNWRDERVTLDGAAYAPGAPRQPGQIPRIEPGSDAVRRFVFAGAYTALKGEQIYIGFIDTDTEARLNASAIVP